LCVFYFELFKSFTERSESTKFIHLKFGGLYRLIIRVYDQQEILNTKKSRSSRQIRCVKVFTPYFISINLQLLRFSFRCIKTLIVRCKNEASRFVPKCLVTQFLINVNAYLTKTTIHISVLSVLDSFLGVPNLAPFLFIFNSKKPWNA
jgi:hypothetical protein